MNATTMTYDISVEDEDPLLCRRIVRAYVRRSGKSAWSPNRHDSRIGARGPVVLLAGDRVLARCRVERDRLSFIVSSPSKENA